MSIDRQERSGLLSEEPDDDAYLDETRNSPQLSDNDTTEPSRAAFPYITVGILVFTNAMVIASFHVVYPFISKFKASEARPLTNQTI